MLIQDNLYFQERSYKNVLKKNILLWETKENRNQESSDSILGKDMMMLNSKYR